jgi:chromate reductase
MRRYQVGYFVGKPVAHVDQRGLSKVLIRVAPDDLEFREIPDRQPCPVQRRSRRQLPPESVALKEAISESDAVLFVTPEYNRSIPEP